MGIFDMKVKDFSRSYSAKTRFENMTKTEIEQRMIDDGIIAYFNNMQSNESSVIVQLKILLITGDFNKLFKCGSISRYRFEYTIDKFRIDLILFHNDGGISIIEAKSGGFLREVVAGIGQLFAYELYISDKFKEAKYINKILCSTSDVKESSKLIRICNNAGVKFVQLAEYGVLRQIKKEMIEYEESLNNG
jgi:hypothetical protein